MREIILTAKLGLWTNYAGIYLHIWRNKIKEKIDVSKLNIPKCYIYIETGIHREQLREIPEQSHARPEKELPESSSGGERERESR
jgi:hypothetical protein